MFERGEEALCAFLGGKEDFLTPQWLKPNSGTCAVGIPWLNQLKRFC